MKFKTISINKLSWKSSMMKAPKLEKIYNSVGFINQRSTYQYTTNQKETVVFFCMEKRDNLITFIELNKKIKYGPQPLIYFPYSHLSSLPLNFKDSCILFKEISQYLSEQAEVVNYQSYVGGSAPITFALNSLSPFTCTTISSAPSIT